MILCVDIKSLKESSEVQRDVNLGDLINNHTRYFDSVEDAAKICDIDLTSKDFWLMSLHSYDETIKEFERLTK